MNDVQICCKLGNTSVNKSPQNDCPWNEQQIHTNESLDILNKKFKLKWPQQWHGDTF